MRYTMMSTIFEYSINDRILATFKPINEKLKLQPKKNYLFDLSYLAVLDVEGTQALDFLQGQLTCNVHSISDIQMVQGAQCNLKGRILSLMDIVSWQGVKLVLPKDLIEPTLNSLNKAAMLSRISLKTNNQISIFGFYLQNDEDILPNIKFFPTSFYAQTYNDYSCLYHLGNGFYILLVQSDFAHDIKQSFVDKGQILGSLTWHTLRLAQQQIEIYPTSRGLFLPHRLDLHQTHYISFNKGCYKGQEIIARMHYKATLKHQLKIYEIKTEQKIYSGQKFFSAHQSSELGELIDFSILDHGHYLVALSIITGAEHSVLFEGHEKLIDLTKFSTTLIPS